MWVDGYNTACVSITKCTIRITLSSHLTDELMLGPLCLACHMIDVIVMPISYHTTKYHKSYSSRCAQHHAVSICWILFVMFEGKSVWGTGTSSIIFDRFVFTKSALCVQVWIIT